MANPGDAVSQDGQYEFWNPNGQSVLMGAATPIRVITVEGLLGLADINNIQSDRSSAHGAFYGGPEFMKGRTITMEIGLEEEDTEAVEALIDRFHATFQPSAGVGYLHMKRRNKQKRVVFCKVRRSMFKGEYQVSQGLAMGAIELFAADPRIYDADAHTYRVSPVTVLTGRTYDMTYDYTYGGLGTIQSLLIGNIGNIPMYPVVRIFGPCKNPRVENITTGQSVDLVITLASGQYIELDMDVHSALVNGEQAHRASVDGKSQWWALLPGVNEIRFFNYGPQTTCYVEVDWRSAWANG
jgi:hypothetical protein